MSNKISDEEKKIKKEKRRLTEIYKNLDEKRKRLSVGLIETAAYTLVKLQELQEDINENGLTEMFSQSDKQEPYARKRPEADLYNTLSNTYLKAIKQLNDLLPKQPPEVATPKSDGFDEFVAGRAEL